MEHTSLSRELMQDVKNMHEVQTCTYLAMFPAAATRELCDMVATRLIPCPSAPRSYT